MNKIKDSIEFLKNQDEFLYSSCLEIIQYLEEYMDYIDPSEHEPIINVILDKINKKIESKNYAQIVSFLEGVVNEVVYDKRILNLSNEQRECKGFRNGVNRNNFKYNFKDNINYCRWLIKLSKNQVISFNNGEEKEVFINWFYNLISSEEKVILPSCENIIYNLRSEVFKIKSDMFLINSRKNDINPLVLKHINGLYNIEQDIKDMMIEDGSYIYEITFSIVLFRTKLLSYSKNPDAIARCLCKIKPILQMGFINLFEYLDTGETNESLAFKKLLNKCKDDDVEKVFEFERTKHGKAIKEAFKIIINNEINLYGKNINFNNYNNCSKFNMFHTIVFNLLIPDSKDWGWLLENYVTYDATVVNKKLISLALKDE